MLQSIILHLLKVNLFTVILTELQFFAVVDDDIIIYNHCQ